MKKLLFFSLILILLKINIVFSSVNLEIQSTSPNFGLKGHFITKRENISPEKLLPPLPYKDHFTQTVDVDAIDGYFSLNTGIKTTGEEQQNCGFLRITWQKSKALSYSGIFHIEANYIFINPQNPQCKKLGIMLHVQNGDQRISKEVCTDKNDSAVTALHQSLNVNYMIDIFEKEEN